MKKETYPRAQLDQEKHLLGHKHKYVSFRHTHKKEKYERERN